MLTWNLKENGFFTTWLLYENIRGRPRSRTQIPEKSSTESTSTTPALAKVWLRGDNPLLLRYGVYLLRHPGPVDLAKVLQEPSPDGVDLLTKCNSSSCQIIPSFCILFASFLYKKGLFKESCREGAKELQHHVLLPSLLATQQGRIWPVGQKNTF